MGGNNQQQGGIAASPLGQAVRRAAQGTGLDNQFRSGGPVVGDFGPGGNTIQLPPGGAPGPSGPVPGPSGPAPYPMSPGNPMMNWGTPAPRAPVPEGGKGIRQPLFSTPNDQGGIPENPNAFFFPPPKISQIIPAAFPSPGGDPTAPPPDPFPGGGPCPAGQERGPDGICRNVNPSK